ncbi:MULTISPECIES: Scr1 family TA system antitoxin-like transcriptional regulator [Streptomyces]|uniref:Scr1 family TA system antitoxin-like transcriptional regulator n=1 Tax=Streptomyces TaxID=1883 RepID=UPI00167A23F7|nr:MULTISPECIES: Scr1 family TA system antitoxin-like transcriptional regulator [Streptomyces]MBK3526552.1 hypothetical protein [Streptomyces sp. MBT70]GGR80424.1 hypothetical protein GCM10010236_38930 [Streptomyces eurythermus]
MYTNVGVRESWRGQIKRLLRDMALPSLRLGILPATAEVDVVPMPGFNMYDMYDGRRAHYELVSSGVDVTDPGEVTLHDKAFDAVSRAASYGDSARSLTSKALAFWSEG